MKNWPNRIIESYRIFPTFHSSGKSLKKRSQFAIFSLYAQDSKRSIFKRLGAKIPRKVSQLSISPRGKFAHKGIKSRLPSAAPRAFP